MRIVSYIAWKRFVGTGMGADKPVVFVTDAYLSHSSLKHCRLPMARVQYRVIVAIILKVIIIRYAQEELIVTDREPALWKRAHPRFIIGFKSIRSGSANVFPVLEITLVDVCYYFFRLLIDAVQARISSLFQALDQVRFKVLDVVFYRCFSFWLARRGRQDDRFVAVFQIGENCIEQQTIFRMPGYSCFEI